MDARTLDCFMYAQTQLMATISSWGARCAGGGARARSTDTCLRTPRSGGRHGVQGHAARAHWQPAVLARSHIPEARLAGECCICAMLCQNIISAISGMSKAELLHLSPDLSCSTMLLPRQHTAAAAYAISEAELRALRTCHRTLRWLTSFCRALRNPQ